MIVSSEAELPVAKPAIPPALTALVAPDVGMERQAKLGGVWFSLIVAMVCALLSASAQSLRVDAREATLKRAEMQGNLQNMSDKQIEDDTRQSERVFVVTKIAGAAVEGPLWLGLSCLGLLALSWFLKGRIVGSAVGPVAAATLLPGAVANLLDAITAFRHSQLPLQGAMLSPRNLNAVLATLGHPLMPPWQKLGNAFDFFSLWTALLMGFGVVWAGQVPVRRALIGTMVAWVLWRLVTNVATGG